MSFAGISKDAELRFVEHVLTRASSTGADAAQAMVVASERFRIRFDARKITLAESAEDTVSTLSVFRRSRRGSVMFSGRTGYALISAVDDAIARADAAFPDTANGIADVAFSMPAIEHGPETTDRERMIDRVIEHIETVSREFPIIQSSDNCYEFIRSVRTFANTTGLHRRETRSQFVCTSLFGARHDGKTTSFNHHIVSSLRPFDHLIEGGALRHLYGEIALSAGARPVPRKFVGDIILEPTALEMLIDPLAQALSGYALIAGASPFRGRSGDTVASSGFNLSNRPGADIFASGADFDEFGLTTSDLVIIENGILRDFLIDFYASRKLDMKQTAGKWAFQVGSGTKSISKMITETERGVILPRFSGGNPSNNMDFSGIAKNAFYIEDGAIRYPVSETMISGNLQDLLQQIRAISSETVNFGRAEYPYLALSGATISAR
jgi:PmbA protein